MPEKLDTSETSVVLTGLQDDVRYECVVKAANEVGMCYYDICIYYICDKKM